MADNYNPIQNFLATLQALPTGLSNSFLAVSSRWARWATSRRKRVISLARQSST